MERVPPTTRTKDDANKELLEIELKINAEKTKLETITKSRSDAEEGFAAREQKVVDIETEHVTLLDSINDTIVKKKECIKELDTTIGDKTTTINGLVESIKSLETNYAESKSEKDKDIELLNNTIKSNNGQIVLLNQEISDAEATKKLAYENISKLNTQFTDKKKELDDRIASVEERERVCNEKEIKLENVKSTIRTLSVRFHEKHGDKLNTILLAATTVD